MWVDQPRKQWQLEIGDWPPPPAITC
jgi:hypothetical protein